MEPTVFQNLADAYEALVDWPKRLANETPLFRALFKQHGVRNVLDAACGTGQHAALFHSWGLCVQGADVSPAMIELCRRRYGESETLQWVVRSFAEPVNRQFDACICVGNSLALVPDMDTVRRAVREMVAALHRGGVAFIQMLNLWRLPEGPVVWQKFRRIALESGEHALVKGVHRVGTRGYFEFVDLKLTVEGLTAQHECVPFLGLHAEELADMVHAAGARVVHTWGDYQQGMYQAEQSADLILVIEK